VDSSTEIERLVARRAAIWAGREEGAPGEVQRISGRLADLYEQRRHERTQAATGRKPEDIRRQARVETELERLMTRRS